MTCSVGPDRRSRVAKLAWTDSDVPPVVLDLASVETYLLVRPLSGLADERDAAVWCPLTSKPAPLDLDVDAARACANRLEIPFARPEPHPSPVPRAMRLATFPSARARGATFTIRGPVWPGRRALISSVSVMRPASNTETSKMTWRTTWSSWRRRSCSTSRRPSSPLLVRRAPPPRGPITMSGNQALLAAVIGALSAAVVA